LLNWTVIAGENDTEAFYLWSNSTYDLNVTYKAVDWYPSGVEANLTLSWNQTADWMILPRYTPTPVEFILTADANATATSFNFTLVITGKGMPP